MPTTLLIRGHCSDSSSCHPSLALHGALGTQESQTQTPGRWEGQRRLGARVGRVGFIAANAPRVWWVHSQAQLLAPQPASCVTLGVFLHLSVPRLPHRPNEDSTGTSSWGVKDIQAAGTKPTPGLVLPPSPPKEQGCHNLGCSDTRHRAVIGPLGQGDLPKPTERLSDLLALRPSPWL